MDAAGAGGHILARYAPLQPLLFTNPGARPSALNIALTSVPLPPPIVSPPAAAQGIQPAVPGVDHLPQPMHLPVLEVPRVSGSGHPVPPGTPGVSEDHQTTAACEQQEAEGGCSVGLTPQLLQLLYASPTLVKYLLDMQRTIRTDCDPERAHLPKQDLLSGLWVAVRTPSGAPVLRPILGSNTPALDRLCTIPTLADDGTLAVATDAAPDTVQVHLRPPVHVPVSQLVDLQGSGASEIDLLCELSAWWLTCNKPPPKSTMVTRVLELVSHALHSIDQTLMQLSTSNCRTADMLRVLLTCEWFSNETSVSPEVLRAVEALPTWDHQMQLQAMGRWALGVAGVRKG